VSSFDPEIRECIDARRRTQINTAAVPAIAPVGPAEGDKFFTPKAGAATATVAGLDFQARFVDKFHGCK
jgi:hypothetical protein